MVLANFIGLFGNSQIFTFLWQFICVLSLHPHRALEKAGATVPSEVKKLWPGRTRNLPQVVHLLPCLLWYCVRSPLFCIFIPARSGRTSEGSHRDTLQTDAQPRTMSQLCGAQCSPPGLLHTAWDLFTASTRPAGGWHSSWSSNDMPGICTRAKKM